MQHRPAGFARRLGAATYDALLLIALLFVATIPAVAVVALLQGSESFAGGAPLAGDPYYRAYLFIVTVLFFLWFWSHGGQTLGMRAWRLRLVGTEAGPPTLARLLLRLLAGGAWIAVSAGLHRALDLGVKTTLGLAGVLLLLTLATAVHDRLAGTQVIVEPPRPR